MTQIEPVACKMCGGEATCKATWGTTWYFSCSNTKCSADGPLRETGTEALAAWNALMSPGIMEETLALIIQGIADDLRCRPDNHSMREAITHLKFGTREAWIAGISAAIEAGKVHVNSWEQEEFAATIRALEPPATFPPDPRLEALEKDYAEAIKQISSLRSLVAILQQAKPTIGSYVDMVDRADALEKEVARLREALSYLLERCVYQPVHSDGHKMAPNLCTQGGAERKAIADARAALNPSEGEKL